MAKMVKCPTCGTQIEVPQQPGGQIVKCPGCGKGLKLVVKKPASPSAPAHSPGGSIAGHSVSGSVSAMTFNGDPPPLDDLPSLDGVCEVCGRPTDPSKLVEDNGKQVCQDCIKGARSKIDRPTGGAELVDFAAASMPTRRAHLINITPAFIIAALAAVILIVCQVYLTLFMKPQGTLTAKSASPALVVEPALEPPATTQSTEQPATTTQPAPAPEPTSPPPSAATQSSPEIATSAPSTAPIAAEPAHPPLFDSPNDQNASPIASSAPSTAPSTTAVAISIEHLGPLDQGITYLQAKDYPHAEHAFQAARRLYPLGEVGEKITPEAQLALCGEGAALIGEGRLNDARAKFGAILKRQGEPTRGTVLNHAIAESFGTVNPADLDDAAARLKKYLEGHPGDEFASDVFGTVLYRLSHLANEDKPERFDPFWKFLDDYRDKMAHQANAQHANQLMWGIDWMPEDDVNRYRLLRGKVAAIGLPQAQRELDIAKTRVAAAQRALDGAKQALSRGEVGVDLSGAQRQFDFATANLQKAQATYTETSNIIKQPRWLEKPEPVVPEPVTSTNS